MFGNNIGICKFCGKTDKLIKSHIIPKCMQLQNKGEKLHMIKSDSNFIDTVHYQNGYTKSDILCAECDNYMGWYDKLAKDFFSQDLSQYTAICAPYNVYVIPLYDDQYEKLKKFFASVVLRTSLSENLLGDKYTKKFIQYLKSMIADIEELEIIVRKITNTISDFNVLSPKSRIAERYCYHYQSFGYEFICKVDGQPWSKDLDCLLLKNNVFPILQIDRSEVLDYNQLKDIATRYHCIRNSKKP